MRINQLGYRPTGPKRAVWVSDMREPAAFCVCDRGGAAVFGGRTRPWPVRPEPTSGMAVHVLDFSDLRAEGEGFAIEVDGARSHAFALAGDLYRGLVRDALAFFYLQRSGIAIDEARAPGYGRPAGHPGDRSVEAWTGPDAERLYPGWSCPGRFDVSGGWYDAGDHGKYVTSGAMPVWQLLATVELIRRRGTRSAWWARTEALLLEECRWQLDWLLRMQVPPGTAHAGMAFHRVHGTEWPPLPCWPHEDPTTRVLHRPSSAATLHLAAAAAHGARVFDAEPAYAGRLLDAAVTADRAAHAEPLLLAPDDQGAFGGGPYADDDVEDERAWAATELWLATGDTTYAESAGRALPRDVFELDGFDWNRMAGPAALDLALHGESFDGHERVVAGVAAAADRLIELQDGQPWGQPYAPAGGWDWGSNGRVLNNLVVLAVAHELTGRDEHFDAATGGLDYLLGCNALGQSYVTGYGTDFTRHQRARHFAHDLDPSFPPPPPARSPAGRPPRTTRASRPTRAWPACRRSAATSTSSRRRRRTTSVSAGTPRSCGWPPSSPHEPATGLPRAHGLPVRGRRPRPTRSRAQWRRTVAASRSGIASAASPGPSRGGRRATLPATTTTAGARTSTSWRRSGWRPTGSRSPGRGCSRTGAAR